MLNLKDTLRLQSEGYTFLATRRAKSPDPEVTMVNFFREPAVVVAGPQLAATFYNDDYFTRRNAMPGFVQDTLCGRRGVQTLTGLAHADRKRLLLQVLQGSEGLDLIDHVVSAWNHEIGIWRDQPSTELHESVATVLFVSACRWLGVPLPRSGPREGSRWMLAMVDGFMPTGPRHLRARHARHQAENWIRDWIDEWRHGVAAEGSRFDILAHQSQGRLGTKALVVEILNLIRPITAVSWFVTFAAHALHHQPHLEDVVIDDSSHCLAFAQEVRRYYPFVPFLGARATTDVAMHDVTVSAGTLTLLDVYGQHHSPLWWDDPHQFLPERFIGKPIEPFLLLPQGAGDLVNGHRCPGEEVTTAILTTLTPRLAQLGYSMKQPDQTISLGRLPARIPDGFVIEDVRLPATSRGPE